MTNFQALLVAAAPTLAIVISRILTKRDLGTIHVLVNNRMSEALKRITELEQVLHLNPGERVPKDGP